MLWTLSSSLTFNPLFDLFCESYSQLASTSHVPKTILVKGTWRRCGREGGARKTRPPLSREKFSWVENARLGGSCCCWERRAAKLRNSWYLLSLASLSLLVLPANSLRSRRSRWEPSTEVSQNHIGSQQKVRRLSTYVSNKIINFGHYSRNNIRSSISWKWYAVAQCGLSAYKKRGFSVHNRSVLISPIADNWKLVLAWNIGLS